MKAFTPLLLPLLLASCGMDQSSAQTANGFDVSNASIPVREILSGGPPRDGIPSIDAPNFISPSDAIFMRDDDIVISLTHEGITRAYPFRILIWHEIVNDVVGGKSVAITYCPLCNTAMVFDRVVQGKTRSFGVSGLLYQSDVLMYDRETESLWSQIQKEAVSGPAVGTKLEWLPSTQLTWKAWQAEHPKGEVLSTETGNQRDYGGSPYEGYFAGERPMFPVARHRDDLPDMTLVQGVIVDGEAKAFPLDKLPDDKLVLDEIAGQPVAVTHDRAARKTTIRSKDGELLPSVTVFWFAWQAFYPETKVWEK